MTGRFIVLEGGEGAGKSSVQQALGGRLLGDGIDVLLTREPGGTPLGERIRDLVLAERAIDDPLTELLLFEAARAHLVATVIRPACERGTSVLCDRFSASSIAYQGFGRGLGRETVERANAIATGGLDPDLTLLLDLPPDRGLARRSRDGASNHFEATDIAFHERVRVGFRELARESPATWRVIDAAQPLDAVVEAAYREVTALHGLRR